MFKTVKNKLIFLYTITTGIILTIVLAAAIWLLEQQEAEGKIKVFPNHLSTIANQLQIENKIGHFFMGEMEVRNQLILSIEDNGIPLDFKGVFHLRSDRKELIEKVKTEARKDRIDTNSRPISTGELRSKIYLLKGDKGEEYCGSLLITPVGSGYRSIILLQYMKGGSAYQREKLPQTLAMLALDLLGIFALYLVSRWFVNKALRPVEESRRRQIEFIASASHELRSPLAVIRANASILVENPEQVGHFSLGIEQECKRMARLIEDLLFLASADGRNWSLKKEEVSMDTLFIDTYELFFPMVRKKGMRLELELQEDPFPMIWGDRERLQQILAILLDNGMTYAFSGKTLTLRGYETKKEVVMEVEDHGEGILEEKKQEIFRRFYRIDASRKDKSHFGLGLSIAAELISLMNAELTIRDTVGGGTTFVVKLKKKMDA